jgi:NAD(P)-dependent dehydrogenase (short-subunit alcohol dehydrogenase family)
MEELLMSRLDGMSTIVAGVGPIGRAIAQAYAHEGARVWCLDIDESAVSATTESIVALGGDASGMSCDSTRPNELEEAIAAGVRYMGGLDVFMTTVGGGGFPVPFMDLPLDLWRDVIDKNLTSSFLSSQVAAKHMVARKKGSIILTSSQLGQVAFPGLAHYCAAKGGINQLVKVMANDLAQFGIRANALGPGPTRSIEAQEQSVHARRDTDPGQRARDRVPMNRWGLPEEVAHGAVFLASDESAFVTGTTLLIDGGYTSL